MTARSASGTTATGYLGTIHMTSSDAQAGLPANYTFTSADDGSHTFTVTLKTSGSQSITATDTATPAVTGTLSGINVSPGAARVFVLAGLPGSLSAGAVQTFTVTARDAYGNMATGYIGTVKFTSSDTQATLPANYKFTAVDQGAHHFTVTFATAGPQSLTVKDTNSGTTATQSGISVAPAAPTNLSAVAASASQINLAWTGSAGAVNYLIERSLNGSSGWTQIASIAANTTSYQDSGLSVATTYYYRVRAAAGNLDSAYSNAAGATTSGTSAIVDTLWNNSYVPSENTYSGGAYELGVKFTASVSGSVTGVRFYEQSWMGGYAHVGHLWSSTGALLATAMFTQETASGWQQVSFSNPVPIQTNAVYVVSFSTGGGYFGITTNYFNKAGVTSGPLQALANGASGGDGVYQRGGAFPSLSGAGENFWVDVAFVPSTSTSNHSSVSTTSLSPLPAQSFGGTAARIGVSPFVVPSSTAAPMRMSTFLNDSPVTSGTRGSESTAVPGSWRYRRNVSQGFWKVRGAWLSGSNLGLS